MKCLPLDAKYLRECFRYNRRTGSLKWKHRPRHHFLTPMGFNWFNSVMPGKEAGWKAFRRGGTPHHIAVEIRIGGRTRHMTVHRIALTMCGVNLCNRDGDHKNGNPFDNRFRNLRAADKYESARNKGPLKRNGKPRLLPKGVYQDGKRFMAKIGPAGRIYLGMFDTPELASRAYEKKAKELFGEFYRKAA